jgi:hypothetical protein
MAPVNDTIKMYQLGATHPEVRKEFNEKLLL